MKNSGSSSSKQRQAKRDRRIKKENRMRRYKHKDSKK